MPTAGRSCIESNINILNLVGGRVPYNLCRNLEWQVCAARGALPGQGGRTIRFAVAPSELRPAGGSKPLSQCGGWRPADPPEGGYGFANDDIFYLEVCVFAQICANGADIFGSFLADFVCECAPARRATEARPPPALAQRSRSAISTWIPRR